MSEEPARNSTSYVFTSGLYPPCTQCVPPQIADPIRKQLLPLIATYLYPALELLRARLLEIVHSLDCALVLKFLELLDYRLRPLTGKDDRPPPPANFLALMRTILTYS